MNDIHPQFFVINLVTKSGGGGSRGIRLKGIGARPTQAPNPNYKTTVN